MEQLKIRNWQIAQAAQNAKEKYTNLFAAEAEMGKRAVVVLNEHGNNLRETYGCGYTAQLTSGNTVDDLIQNLQNGYPTNIHIARPVDIFDTNGHLAFFGGFPHTLTVVGYDANTDYWQLLDPINPNTYTEWKTKQLVDNWGRKFLFYPPRFSMTTLIPDTICNPPASPSNSDGNLPQPQ